MYGNSLDVVLFEFHLHSLTIQMMIKFTHFLACMMTQVSSSKEVPS